MAKSEIDFWDERYKDPVFVYGEIPNKYLEEKLLSLPVGKVLFPAEGEGRNAVYAAEKGWQAIAFDQSVSAKKKAEILASKKNVTIKYAIETLESVDYPENSFDALVLIYAHFHSDFRRIYHQKLSRFIKPGGWLILEAFQKEQILNQAENPKAGGPKNSEMLYDLDELKEDFEDFDFKEAEVLDINLNEGNYHVGKAAVIRIFARKKTIK